MGADVDLGVSLFGGALDLCWGGLIGSHPSWGVAYNKNRPQEAD